jgi:hypothetical protein
VKQVSGEKVVALEEQKSDIKRPVLPKNDYLRHIKAI